MAPFPQRELIKIHLQNGTDPIYIIAEKITTAWNKTKALCEVRARSPLEDVNSRRTPEGARASVDATLWRYCNMPCHNVYFDSENRRKRPGR